MMVKPGSVVESGLNDVVRGSTKVTKTGTRGNRMRVVNGLTEKFSG